MATVPEELKTKKDDAPVVETITEVTETPVDKAENPVATKTAEPQGFYADYFTKYGKNKPLTESELEQQAKKRKREKIFAAIGDGISALSNLYFTTKGAPNVAQNPMSDKVKARWDAIEAERKGNETAWYQGYLQSLQLDEARAAAKRKEKADKDAYDLRVKEYQRKVAKDEADAEKRRNETQKEQYLAEQERIEKEYMERTGMKMPTTKVGGGSSSGGVQGSHPIYKKDGKGGIAIAGYTKSYDSAVAASAKNGVVIKKVKKTNKNITGTESTSELVTKILVDGKEVPVADVVEATENNAANATTNKPEGTKKTNPMSSGKKKNPMSY